MKTQFVRKLFAPLAIVAALGLASGQGLAADIKEVGALGGQLLGNAPGQRAVVGDTHDQPALPRHQSHG